MEAGSTFTLALGVAPGVCPSIVGSGAGGTDCCEFAVNTVVAVLKPPFAFCACFEENVGAALEAASKAEESFESFGVVGASNDGYQHGGGGFAFP